MIPPGPCGTPTTNDAMCQPVLRHDEPSRRRSCAALALSAVGCGGPRESAVQNRPAMAPCTIAGIDARCGSLTVPENRTSRTGRTIALNHRGPAGRTTAAGRRPHLLSGRRSGAGRNDAGHPPASSIWRCASSTIWCSSISAAPDNRILSTASSRGVRRPAGLPRRGVSDDRFRKMPRSAGGESRPDAIHHGGGR